MRRERRFTNGRALNVTHSPYVYELIPFSFQFFLLQRVSQKSLVNYAENDTRNLYQNCTKRNKQHRTSIVLTCIKMAARSSSPEQLRHRSGRYHFIARTDCTILFIYIYQHTFYFCFVCIGQNTRCASRGKTYLKTLGGSENTLGDPRHGARGAVC